MKRTVQIRVLYISILGLVLLVASCLMMVLSVKLGTGLGTAGMATGVVLFALSIALIVPAEEKERMWDIWAEGFAATGQSGLATYHRSFPGRTFREAVDLYARQDKSFAKYYNPDQMTYWGCRLFDNASDAKASFG